MHQEVLASLKKIPFLSKLSEDVLLTLAEKAKPAKFPKQATILTEGDETSSLYIILSGKVRVFSSDDKSKEVTLLIQEPGSYFGEIALLSEEPRSASVATLEATTCAVVSKTDFINWLMCHPNVAIDLLGVLSEKVRHLTDKVKLMALSNVYERVVKTLMAMTVVENGVTIIHNRTTQQELAEMVGASREMINKIMHELTKGGYITIADKMMIINKKLPNSW